MNSLAIREKRERRGKNHDMSRDVQCRRTKSL